MQRNNKNDNELSNDFFEQANRTLFLVQNALDNPDATKPDEAETLRTVSTNIMDLLVDIKREAADIEHDGSMSTEDKYNLKKINELLDALHTKLIILANFKPVNQNDPITREAIEPNDKVVVSTGHQFDINSLVDYHNNRAYRGSELGERDNSMFLLNPLTNQVLSDLDAKHVIMAARARQIEINNLIPELFLFQVGFSEEQKRMLIDSIRRGDRIEDGDGTIFHPNIHGEIINYLIKERGYTIDQTLAEIKDFNQHEISILKEFYDDGLRGDNIRELDNYIDETNVDDYMTIMRHLMQRNDKTSSFVISELSPKNAVEIHEMATQIIEDGERARLQARAEQEARWDAEEGVQGILPWPSHEEIYGTQQVPSDAFEPSYGDSNSENEEGESTPRVILDLRRSFALLLINLRNDLTAMTDPDDIQSRIMQAHEAIFEYYDEIPRAQYHTYREAASKERDLTQIEFSGIKGYFTALSEDLSLDESELNQNPNYDSSTAPEWLKRSLKYTVGQFEGYLTRLHRLDDSKLDEMCTCLRECHKVLGLIDDINRLLPPEDSLASRMNALRDVLTANESRVNQMIMQEGEAPTSSSTTGASNQHQSSTASLFQNLEVHSAVIDRQPSPPPLEAPPPVNNISSTNMLAILNSPMGSDDDLSGKEQIIARQENNRRLRLINEYVCSVTIY